MESIVYWKDCGLNIDAVVYWVFEISGEYFIEFNTYSTVDDYLEYENNCYVLNTDYNNNRAHHEEMLAEKKAAAYYPGWRENIQKLQKGDIVFLYQSGTGIVAYGNADGILRKAPCNGIDDYEYSMHLDNFKVIQPISASEMKILTQQGFSFRKTMFPVSEAVAHKFISVAKII